MSIECIKITICAPSDVNKEVEIAKEVINEWNRTNHFCRKVLLQCQHWSSDASPDISQRPQEIINKQLIDSADILIAIFWCRIGTATGLYESGTEEEIKYGLAHGKRVMVYFSNLNPPTFADFVQLKRLENLREQLQKQGLCKGFSSREEFRKLLPGNLSEAVDKLLKDADKINEKSQYSTSVSQFQSGRQNIQIGPNSSVHLSTPRIKHVTMPRTGSATPKELSQINTWIEELAESEVNLTRDKAYGKWGKIFNNEFHLDRRDSFESSRMQEAEAWFRKQRILLKEGYKTKDPEAWRKDKYKAIKTYMGKLRRTNEDYYPELSQRLRLKKPFKSLTELTEKDIRRVYNMIRRDFDGV